MPETMTAPAVQPLDVEGIYLANSLHRDGVEHMVMVGLDANGAARWDGVVGDMSGTCPPFCPPAE